MESVGTCLISLWYLLATCKVENEALHSLEIVLYVDLFVSFSFDRPGARSCIYDPMMAPAYCRVLNFSASLCGNMKCMTLYWVTLGLLTCTLLSWFRAGKG